MLFFGTVALLLSSEASRGLIESVFANATLLFADNLRVFITTIVVLSALIMFRYLRGAAAILNNNDTLANRTDVQSELKFYTDQFKDPKAVQKRQTNYMQMVNYYYDLVTDFYEWGWGKSFHFAPRYKGESFTESIARAEHLLALYLRLDKSKRVADIGCGVGGPLRAIVKFSGAHVTGVNNNPYQLKIAARDAAREGLAEKCAFSRGDFMKLTETFPKNHFDAAYEIEATCHAPDKTACFRQIFEILKPGARFAGYEWCITPKHDPKNADHVRIKEGIEIGNSLPDLATFDDVKNALRGAGFRVVEAFDANETGNSNPNEIPWYIPLRGGDFSVKGFLSTKLGGACTHYALVVLEALRIAPKGTVQISSLLRATQQDLIDGGVAGTFTPSYFFVAEKPLDAR